MSKEIEERVVKISLDNSGFEKKANRTVNTLDEIDEKMKFKDASKGFKDVEKAANSVKMSGLLTVLDTAKHKFTSLEVAAITAISNISNRAVDAGVNLVKSLSLDQITEGYSKYEQKTAGVQTIMNATGKSINEVTKSLEKLNWFTDETSYNFVDMVSNIGKFTSVGVDLDDAVTAMEGIANVAAISGQGINEASRAMYNFAQALGTGSVKLIDWKSIENANMATKEFKETIIDIALEEGTLVKSSDGLIKTLEGSEVSVLDFSSALKDQWFNSNVLIKTLGRYGEYADEVYNKVTETGLQCAEAMELVNGETMDLGERAFKAAQEAKTFTDALNATKDAVSTGWMSTFEILFGNYEEAKEVWTELSGDLWDIFAASGAARNELLGEAFNSGSGWDVLVEKIESAGIGINNFETDLAELAKNEGRNVDALIAEHETLENAIKSGALSDLIPTLFKKYTDGAEEATSSTKDLYSIFREYQNLVNQVTKGEFGNDEEQLQTIKDLGYDVAFVQGLVNKAIQGGTVSVEDFSDAQMKAEGYTDEQIAALRELADTANQTGTELNDAINNLDGLSTREIFIDSFRNVIVSLKSVLDTVKNAWEDVFPSWTVENIRDLVKKFHDFTSNLKPTEKQLETVRSVSKGLFSVLSILKQTVVALVQNGFNLLQKLLRYFGIDLGSTVASIGELIYKLDQWLKEGNKINVVISETIEFIMSIIEAVKEAIKAFTDLPEVRKYIETISDAYKNLFNTVKNSIPELSTKFNEFLENVKTLDSFTFENIKNAFDNIFGGETFSKVDGQIKKSTSSITESLNNFWEAVKETVSKINPLSVVFVTSGLAVLIFTKKLTEVTGRLISVLRPVSTAVKDFFGSFSGLLNATKKGVEWYLRAATFKETASGVLTLAAAVAVLTASYYALSKVPTEGVIQAGIALGILVAAVAGLAVVIRKNRVMLKQLSQLFMSIASSVFILISAMKIAQDSTGGFWTVIGMLTLFTSAVILLSKFVKTFPDGMSKASIGIIALAGSIAILTASMKNLNEVDIAGLGWKVLALGSIMAAFIGMIAVSNKAGGIGTMLSGVGMLGFVLSLKLLFIQLSDLADFDFTAIENSLLKISGIALVIAAIVRIAGKASIGVAATVAAISLSIGLLEPVIKKLAEMPKKDLFRGAATIAALSVVFGMVISLSEFAGEHALKAGGMIMMMAAAITGLSFIIWGLGLLDLKTVLQGGIAVGSLMLIFGGILLASKNAEKAAGAISAINVTLSILAVTIGIISNFTKVEGAIAVGSSLVGFMVTLSVLLAIVSRSTGLKPEKIKQVQKIIISISGMFAVLFGSVIAANAIPGSKVESLIVTVSGMVAMMVVFDHLLWAISRLSGLREDKVKQVIKLFALINLILGGLSVVVSAAAMIPSKWQNIAAIFAGASVALLAISQSFTILSGVQPLEDGVIVQLFGLATVAALIGGLITAISSLAGDTVNIANLLTVTVATGALILALSASVRILNGVPAQKIQAAGTIAIELVALVGAMVAIMAAMKLLNPVHTDGLIIKVAAVSLAITTLVGVAALIAALSAPLSAALPVILPAIGTIAIVAGAITAIALVLGLLVAGLGAIDNAIGGGLSDSFATGMEMIGYGIGRFSASIEEAKLASLPIEGQYLSEFAQSSADFFAALQYMDTDKLEMLTKLPKALKKLSKMDIDDEDSETMATNLSAYGTALINFTTSVGSYNADMVKSVELACEAGNMLADHLDNVPNFGGALGAVLGENTWTDFYVGLEYYGECLVNYGNTMLSHMSSKMVKAIELSVDAGKNLAALLDVVPNTGGALAKVLGDNTWWDLTSGLTSFGNALWKFGIYAMGIAPNVGNIEQTVLVGYALTELLKAVPNDQAEWSKSLFGDEHEYRTIYTGLVEFGKQMAKFGETVSPIDANTVTKMKLISEAAENLGYAMQAVKDVKTKGDYGGYTKIVEGLTEFATAIVNFSNDTSELKLSSFQKVKKSIDILLEVVAKDNYDAITKNLPKIGKKLKQYGDDLQDFQDKIAGLDYTAFEMAFSVGTGEVKQRKTGREIVDGKVYDYDQEETSDLDDMITDPEEIKKFKELEASVWEDDTTVTDAAYAAGSATGESYLSGFDDATGINSPSKEMAIRAGYMVEGLAYGLTDRQRQIADSGAYMAGTFLTTFNDVLGIHSPSKEVYEAAKHVVEGFVIGVDEGKSRLAEKSQELGSTVLEHLGLEDIANSVKSGGGDIGTLLVDAIKSKTGFDVTELTDSFSDIGTDLADSLGSSFNDTLSSISSGTDIIQDETLEKAKSEYDVLLNELKAGSISAARYEEDYTKLVQKYSATQSEAYNSALNEVNRLTEGVEYYQKLVDESTDKKSDVYKNNSETLKEYKSALKSAKKELESFSETTSKSNIVLQLQTYSKEQLTEYVNESVSTLQEKYEAAIGEIQSKMDAMSTNFGKTYDDMITYTTNKDVYDKKVTDYEKRIDGVNRKLDESKRKYGENSTQAKRYESQLESLELELQSYKDFYEREEFKDDEIVGIEWSNNLLKETEKLTKYTDEMAKLSERGVSQTFIDYIASQDIDKALATLEWANSQTDKELKKQDKMFTDHEEALKMAKRTTYSGAIDQAEKELQNGMVFLHETLPESAKDIGSEIISNLSASFSEETEKTLSVFGKAGTDIIKAIKLGLGFGELEQEETLSEAMAETGRKTADSQAKGYTDQMASNAASMAQTNAEIQTDVANAGIDAAVKAVEDNGYKIADAYKSTYQMAAEEYAKQEQERQLQQHYDEKDAKNRGAMASWSGYTPTITPQTAAQNAKVISAYTARSMAASINAARALANRAGELPLNTQTDGSNAVVTVVQNNYSPQELTRSDIRNRYRDAMAIANSGY